MSDRMPVALTPHCINLHSPEFEAISGCLSPDPYVARLLREDVPQRVQFGNCRIWIYRDPEGRFAGFGTIDVCDDYSQYTGGQPHPYIPLLAVNPTITSLGYGTTIVRHLIDEAALIACRPGGCHDVLFLDVYTDNEKAIEVYVNCGFTKVSDEPTLDPQEGGKPYVVMARRVGSSS